MLYAYFEGMIKESMSAYLDYVSRSGVHTGKTNYYIRARIYYQELSSHIVKPDDFVTMGNVIHNQGKIDGKPIVHLNTNIITKNNIDSNTLLNIIQSVGLDKSRIECNSAMISCVNELVKARNSIAHTGYGTVSYEAYESMYSEIINGMDTLTDMIDEAIVKEHFLYKV